MRSEQWFYSVAITEEGQDREVQGTKKFFICYEHVSLSCLLKSFVCTLLYVNYTYIKMKAIIIIKARDQNRSIATVIKAIPVKQEK